MVRLTRKVKNFGIIGFVMLMTCNLLLAQEENPDKLVTTLGFMVGQWTVEVDARLGRQGPWEKSQATATIKTSLESNLVEEDFIGTREGRPFLTKSLFAFNKQSNQFQCVFIDGPHGTLIDYVGVVEGETIVFDKLWTYANGNTVMLRTVYKKRSPDAFDVESMRMPQGMTEWDVTGRMKYYRSK